MSRKAPADVPPLEINGIRYEQVMSASLYDLEDNARYLRASRIEDGETLWVKPVFKIKYDTTKERGVQSVYFEVMVHQDDRIVIRNERGVHYSVDPETGKSRRLWFTPKGLDE